jgi:transglutaminase-like putative cysteine protease
LFTTLARALKIPTREVTGLMYDKKGSRSFAPHSWNEVLLGSTWVAVDPSFNRFGINPTYISFGSGAEGRNNFLRTIGKLSFRVVEVTYRT